MNADLVATFTTVSADLATAFGAPMTRQRTLPSDPPTLDEVACQGILEAALVPVGEFGERMEPQHTITVLASLDAQIGDAFVQDGVAGIAPWRAVQVVADDGYFRVFAVRSES